MRNIGVKARKALARKVEEICRDKNFPAKALAEDAGCHVRTIRNFFNGKQIKEATIRKICAVVGVDLDAAIGKQTAITLSSNAQHGSYSEELVRDYVGYFYAFRRSFTVPGDFVRSLFNFEWERNYNCLRFKESQSYESSTLKRRVNYDQTGDVFISNTVGLVHLLTVQLGALRLITLTRLHHDENFMRGVVLTQKEWPDHFQPAVSPIYFRKVLDNSNPEELTQHIGHVRPSDAGYTEIKESLDHIASAVAHFA